ncbi:MAG TPA: hypothetical protein VL337_06475 [Acidimicrobiales bacterium]|jgi:hypothetical protein|nr:hypothetical protein [Acidimicrobiales bacterium]
MLYAFGFERVAVMVGDLYFVNPRPLAGQEGPERGVRLELRVLERGALRGDIYSAQPIAVDRPLWRVDLLESVASAPGSLDRAHHHPRFDGWNPGSRHFVPELSAAPLDWLTGELSDLDAVLARAGAPPGTAGPGDAESLRVAVPEIVDAVRRLLARVAGGELGRPDDDREMASARIGWL